MVTFNDYDPNRNQLLSSTDNVDNGFVTKLIDLLKEKKINQDYKVIIPTLLRNIHSYGSNSGRLCSGSQGALFYFNFISWLNFVG